MAEMQPHDAWYRAHLGRLRPEGLWLRATVTATVPHCSDEKKSSGSTLHLPGQEEEQPELRFLAPSAPRYRELQGRSKSRRESGQTGPYYW
jgi:hypothetical protein